MTDAHILVLAGGLSHERDVSLRSGSRLATALRSTELDVTVRDADATLIDWITDQRPDAAVIALHGGLGENGSIQTLLHMMQIPFVGTGRQACRLAWDKAAAKQLVAAAGLTTPEWVALSHSAFRDFGAAGLVDGMAAQLGLPLVVKPVHGGSALGVSLVRSAAELPAALVAAFAYGDSVLVEQYVAGTEVAITVVDEGDGPRALPVVEIVPPGGVLNYDSRYTAGMTEFFTPARLDAAVLERAQNVALSVHDTLRLRDISRTDAIVTASGEVNFLEVSVSPGLTETSTALMSMAAAGTTAGAVYRSLIETAIRREND